MEIKYQEMSAMDDVKRIQLDQAQSEFYRLDNELRSMVDPLTLVQRQKVNELVMNFIARLDANK